MKKLLILALLMIGGAAYAQKMSAADSSLLATMPPLPEIDTSAAPDDAFTTEVRKMLVRTNALNAGLIGMKASIDMQRKNAGSQIPQAFFDRFNQYIENGRMARIMENLMVKVYRQKFTLSDMKEVNKFYDTPVGKKLAGEMINIMNAARVEGEKLGQYIALEAARDLIKEGKWK